MGCEVWGVGCGVGLNTEINGGQLQLIAQGS